MITSPESDIPQSLMFIPLGYRAMHRVRVSDPRALILPHAEAGGRLLTNLEFRKADERSRIERHRSQASGSTTIARVLNFPEGPIAADRETSWLSRFPRANDQC